MHGDSDRPSTNEQQTLDLSSSHRRSGTVHGLSLTRPAAAWTGWGFVESSNSGPDRRRRPARAPSRPGGATTCTTLPRQTNLAGPSAVRRGLGSAVRRLRCAWPSRACRHASHACVLRVRRALSYARSRGEPRGVGRPLIPVTSSDAVGNGPSARVPSQDQQPRRWAARLASERSVWALSQ